ncbi:MAG TPA: OmpH family outer membrane protein [Thermohalobaculum sp.]|nr:OmpH family outer membrane protein [Thermohalobaculum sp.]
MLVVSRERVLAEAVPAEKLNDAEAAMTADLQGRVDRLKAELADEEQELTQLRTSLPAEEFERRVRDFDRRVRHEREITQRRAAALQTAFRQARQALVEALVPILVALSRERGAKLVLDSDQILVAHPSIDVTDETIALMGRVPMPALPTLEALPPIEEGLPAPDAPTPAPGGESSEEGAPAEGRSEP